MGFTIFMGLLLLATLFVRKIKIKTEDLKVHQLPKAGSVALQVVASVLFVWTTFTNIMFYAEPSMIYHVRTITGNEIVVANTTGYTPHYFGRIDEWKRAMTVQADAGANGLSSANIGIQNIMFLDNVDADAQATVRFSIPTDKETFLKLAHEYRTPDNLLRTALIPAFKETLQANASIMSAEEYYAGGRSQFNNEFEKQMADGTYQVKRNEVLVQAKFGKGTANASKEEQDVYGEDTKTEFIVEKVLDENGMPVVKIQKFTNFGISVVEARVTEMKPNQKFIDRMQLKQQASADRAIAREQRVQEEEQRLLAIARGERKVAERQAEALVKQIELTTNAETEKQLALTSSNKVKEQAAIAKDTAAINLETALIKAKTVIALADAEAHAKTVSIEADNGLKLKLDAEVKIQTVWAAAFSKRNVPHTVMGVAGNSDGDATNFMQIMTMQAAKNLNLDRSLKAQK